MGPLKTELRRIFLLYASFQGIEKTSAQSRYIEMVRKKSPTFGATFFTVGEMEEEGTLRGQQRMLGVIENGFLITNKKDPVMFKIFFFKNFKSYFSFRE